MKNREDLESQLAHLQRQFDDLSDVVARQDVEITALKTRVKLLLQREAEREVAEGGTAAIADRPPPHY